MREAPASASMRVSSGPRTPATPQLRQRSQVIGSCTTAPGGSGDPSYPAGATLASYNHAYINNSGDVLMEATLGAAWSLAPRFSLGFESKWVGELEKEALEGEEEEEWELGATAVFLGVLVLGLAYEFKRGALEWEK